MTNERALEIARDIWSQASDMKMAAVECFAAYLAGFANSATKRRERLEEQNRTLANQMRGVDISNRSLRGEARKLYEKIAVKDKTILALQDCNLELERRIQALRFWQGDKDKQIESLKAELKAANWPDVTETPKRIHVGVSIDGVTRLDRYFPVK